MKQRGGVENARKMVDSWSGVSLPYRIEGGSSPQFFLFLINLLFLVPIV